MTLLKGLEWNLGWKFNLKMLKLKKLSFLNSRQILPSNVNSDILSLEETIPYFGKNCWSNIQNLKNSYLQVWKRVYKFCLTGFWSRLWVKLDIALPKCMSVGPWIYIHTEESPGRKPMTVLWFFLWVFQTVEACLIAAVLYSTKIKKLQRKMALEELNGTKDSRLVTWEPK